MYLLEENYNYYYENLMQNKYLNFVKHKWFHESKNNEILIIYYLRIEEKMIL